LPSMCAAGETLATVFVREGSSMRLCLLVCVALAAVAAQVEKEFSIRPSRDDSVSVTMEGVTCTFSWKDCTGGSSEVWQIRIKARNNGPECSVGRSRDSYLTFTTWRAELTVGDADVAVFDGTGKEMLRGSDFVVTNEQNALVSVVNAKKERHSVQKIILAGVMK
jgi:hypothetical protein